jgi:hypothetical protein
MFNRDRQNGTLVVDDLVVAEGSSPGNTQTINVDQPHYVGGISPEVLNNARHNFKVRLCYTFVVVQLAFNYSYNESD